MSTVKNSPQMAVKLTRSQMSGLRNYLSKAQKMWFYSEDMDQEVWAATTRQGDQVKPDMVTLVRYDKNGKSYLYITLNKQGEVVYSGKGKPGNQPPWVAKL